MKTIFRTLALCSLSIAAVCSAQATSVVKKTLELTNMSTLNESTGFVRMTAEIKNISDRWACSPAAVLSLRDADNKDLKISSLSTASAGGAFTDRSIALRNWLPPGETTPLMYVRDAKNIAGKATQVAASATARDCTGTPPDVKIENVATEVTLKSWAKVTGSIVVNSGSCRMPSAIIAVYAPDGTIESAVTINPTTTDHVAKDGDRIEFIRTSMPFKSETPVIKVWADCAIS